MATWVVEEPKWHWTLQQYLSRFQDKGILCDTVLACANGKSIKAHSCVLAAASERIRNLLKDVQSNGYTLRMDSVTSTTWHYLIRFIYDGRVSLPLDQVEPVKDAAVRFQIVPLINLLNTVDKLKGQIATVESDVGKTSHCQDDSDIIILDDDDDNGAGVVVEKELINLASSDTLPSTGGAANVAGSDSGNLDLRLSSSQNSRLSISNDNSTTSTSVTCFENALLLDESRANISRDISSDACRQSTDLDRIGSQVLPETCISSQFSSVVPYTSLCPALHKDKDRCSSNDTSETVDVSEVICIDSPASGCTQPEENAMNEEINVSTEKSSEIPRNTCSSTALPNTPPFLQTASSTRSSNKDILRQFIVTKPLGKMLPGTKENALSGERVLDTIEIGSIPALKPRVSENEYDPQNGLGNNQLEERMEDEEPLLCISNVVSLSGQMTDFAEPDVASNSNKLCYLPSTAETEVSAEDLRTEGSCASTPFISLSPPSTMENETVNLSESVKEIAKTTQISNCAAAETEMPLPETAFRVNLSSSVRLSGDEPGLFDGSKLCVSVQRNSSSSLSGAKPALRFLVVRSTESVDRISSFLSKHNSRKSETFPLPKKRFLNIRAPVSHHSTLPQSFSGGDRQFPVPHTVTVSSNTLSDCVEELPGLPAIPFPLSDYVEEFPVPQAVTLPSGPPSGCVEESVVPSAVPFRAVSRVPGSVVELSSDTLWTEESNPKPTGCVIPPGIDRAEEMPSIVVPVLKSPHTFLVESTTTKRPQFVKAFNDGMKQGLKRRLAMIPVESAETPMKPSDNTTEFRWPEGSQEFNGCTKLTTHHDCQRKSQTGTSSAVAKVTRIRKTRKLTEPPPSVVDPSGKPDLPVACRSSADETTFVQPDSTVVETRPLPLAISIYNFAESDNESNMLPGKRQPSITSTQPSATVHNKVVKRRGRKPGSSPAKKPTQPKISKEKLQPATEGDKPKRKRRTRKAVTVNGSDGSVPIHDLLPNVQFVGRDIRHEWVVGAEPGATRWYIGKVLRVVSGKDGEKNSQYEVKYDGEDMSYLIDHLLDDYLDGCLRFV